MLLNSDLDFQEKFEPVLEEELAFVRKRWEQKVGRRSWWNSEQKAFFGTQLRGLALSGGGIRSASFCMGVVQALHVGGVIDRLHYMSTVSGGGYTGSALSWFLSRDRDSGQRWGTLRNNFPFCGGEAAGLRNASRKGPEDPTTGPPPDGRAVLDFIRQRSSYLEPGAGLTKISAAAIVLRSLFVSLLGYVLLASLLFLPLITLNLLSGGPHDLWSRWPEDLNWPLSLSAVAAGILAVGAILYSLISPAPLGDRANYGYRRLYQIVAGTVLTIGLASLALALIFELIRFVTEGRAIGKSPNFSELPVLAALWTLAGAGGGFLVKKLQDAGSGLLVRLAMWVVPPVSLLLLVAGIGCGAYVIAGSALRDHWWLALVVVTAVYCLYTNINLTGLHRFYRDRLMETFMPDRELIVLDRRAGMTSADRMDLSDICDERDDGPYHLINGHVVLMAAHKARFRSRLGDSFVMSRLFCGSEATGFVRTRTWLKRRWFLPARPVGPISLPTAMAISGAALNPNAGADGQGITKSPAVAALLNLLNLRLGFWVPSGRPGLIGRRWSQWWPPNFIFPGVVQGLLGLRHHENSDWLELTDGGHFENTGIYELVRRGVRTIIFADGSTDPEISLQSFANVLEKIYIDFNVTVTFPKDRGELHFINLMKGTGEPRDSIAERLQFAKAGFAIGRIRYPGDPADAPSGYLIYIKSTMTRELPAALYSYKATNPLFPSESLADQFFSEQQFEAYRALGFALTSAMLDQAKGPEKWGDALSAAPPERAA